MAYLVKARVGRSQGAVIFWGLVSAFFASAFCYYYLENRTNEEKNRQMVDEVMTLQTDRDALTAERTKIESAASDNQKQMNDREQFLQEKENNLAQEESQLEASGPQGQSASQQSAQAAGVKKFDDAVRKLAAKVPDAEVIVRGGRPVLRVPNSSFFDPASEQLKPDGKSLLTLIAQAATGTSSRLELRVETFTDSAGETPDNPTTSTSQKSASIDAWTLTGMRAAAIAHNLRDSGALPFQNVVAIGRADFLPLESHAKQDQSRNRRVEFTIVPVAPTFHTPEPSKVAHGKASGTTVPVAPQSDTSASTGSP